MSDPGTGSDPDAVMEMNDGVAAAAAAAAGANATWTTDESAATEQPALDDDAVNKPEEPQQPQSQQVAVAAPQQYSTRGRSSDPASLTNCDPLERLARQALGELSLPHRDPPPPSRLLLQNSFLSDSITEEERRTRTRYIPAVEGMQALKKLQVKADLALMMTSATASVSGGKKGQDDAAMDKNSDDASMSKRDTTAESIKADMDTLKKTCSGTQVIQSGGVTLTIPSTAFLPPPPPDIPSTTPPTQVDSVTAFNPPRPPESIGSKKKHRMIRWERRPTDVETDLRNYRKTVERTRDELTRAQLEVARVHAVEALVRRHTLEHLRVQQQEWNRLSSELDRVQQACVTTAGLTATRTRNRSGSSKNNNFGLMREVLGVVRVKGMEIEAKGLLSQAPPPLTMMEVEGDDDNDMNYAGVGGVAAVNFQDWDRNTKVVPTKLASAWILPGDCVETPYGKGEVVVVLGVEKVNPKAILASALNFGGSTKVESSAMDVEEPITTDTDTGKGDESSKLKSRAKVGFVLPRVAVRLPFGIGFFQVDSVTRTESSILTYSEARLAQRWKGLAETGPALGEVVDCSSMSAPVPVNLEPNIDDLAEGMGEQLVELTESAMIPVGAGMIPTAAGRGVLLAKMSIDELDNEIDTVMFRGAGILGSKENEGVTREVREREDVREDNLRLEATVLQLKNQLYRQRRLRLMNERTHASAQDRAVRVEALVSEMRADLKTLKRRLDEDVADLGINEEQAELILKAYYESLDYKHAGEASPAKRAKREVEATGHGLTDEEDDDDVPMEVHGAIDIQAATA